MHKRTVDPKQINIFNKYINWWNQDLQNGTFLLHKVNTYRVNYVKEELNCKGNDSTQWLKGKNIIDVGCGGGILSESLAKMGGKVLGIDPTLTAVDQAKAHTESQNDPILKENITYQHAFVEDLAEQKQNQFDIVVAFEVIEHVMDQFLFVECLSKLLKPGGVLFMSTIAKTYESYMFMILGAEKLLSIIPEGTHEWSKFINSEDLVRLLKQQNLIVSEPQGYTYIPLLDKVTWCPSTRVNYILHSYKLGA